MSAKGACIMPIITMHMAIKSACSTQVYPVSLPPAAKGPGWQLCAQCITKTQVLVCKTGTSFQYLCHVAQLTLLQTFLPQVNGSIPNIAHFFCCTGLALSTELCYMQHRNLACINSCFSSALASAKMRVCRGSLFFLFALILTSIPSSPY